MSAFGHLTPNFRERADEAFYRMSTPKMAGAATKAEAVSPVAATCREHPVPYPGCPNCPEGGSQ